MVGHSAIEGKLSVHLCTYHGVYMCSCVYVYACMNVLVHAYVCECVCMCVCLVCVHAYMSVFERACLDVRVLH